MEMFVTLDLMFRKDFFSLFSCVNFIDFGGYFWYTYDGGYNYE